MKTNDLVNKYGEMAADIEEIVISEDQIQKRIKEIANQITEDYRGKDPVFVGVLKGVLFFMSELMLNISIPAEMDFLAVTRYSSEARSKSFVRLVKDLDTLITNRHVLFIEDVIDTGLTLNYLLKNLKDREPASLEVCVLFNKPKYRLIDIPLKYKGFDLPDRFVVGFGLDHKEKYRNLPFVGLLKAEALHSSH